MALQSHLRCVDPSTQPSRSGASWVRGNGIVALRRADSKASVSGPTRTYRKVRFYAAIGNKRASNAPHPSVAL